MDNYGILSLAPALIAVILAFITREALFSILCGVLVGLLITGQDLLFGFTGLIQSALGNADYIWVIGIEVFIGIMVAFFQKSGAIEAVANKLNEKLHITPRIAQIMGAALGILVFFSDYFSPLFVGNVMRPSPIRPRSPVRSWPGCATAPPLPSASPSPSVLGACM